MNIKQMEEIVDDEDHPERKYLIMPEYLEARDTDAKSKYRESTQTTEREAPYGKRHGVKR